MCRVLYFDCFSGISGDMALGAMLDAGLPLEELKRALGSLAVSGFDVSAARVLRAGVSATKFTVHEHEGTRHLAPEHGTQHSTPGIRHDHDHHPHRHLPAIFELIDESALSTAGRNRAKA